MSSACRQWTVCRQSISDSWLGNLKECLARLVEGSGCDCLLMQAASLLDGFSFDLFPPLTTDAFITIRPLMLALAHRVSSHMS